MKDTFGLPREMQESAQKVVRAIEGRHALSILAELWKGERSFSELKSGLRISSIALRLELEFLITSGIVERMEQKETCWVFFKLTGAGCELAYRLQVRNPLGFVEPSLRPRALAFGERVA